MKLREWVAVVTRKETFLITLFYSMAFGFMLLNDGIFFDDWVLYNVDTSCIRSIASQVGLPWLSQYYVKMLSLNSMIVCRVVVFTSYLLAALLLYGVLQKIKEISNRERLLITLFFALFPVNFARITLITSQFTISYLLFFLGLFLLSQYFTRKETLMRISALLFLFLSFFSLPSLLVFYVIVILFIAYMESRNIKTITGFLRFPLRYFDFLAVPFVFWVIKNVFFKPYGLYAGHNEVISANLLSAICKLNGVFGTSFIAPLQEAFQYINANYLTIILSALLLSVFAYKAYFAKQDNSESNDFSFLLFGLLAFVLSVYGYLVVDKVPTSLEWYSRFQILVPLGASFIIVYLVRIFFNDKARALVYSTIIVLFICANSLGYLSYQKDWFKQLSLVENFKNSEIVKNNSAFIFNDKTLILNARHRTYYFYEYTGLMKSAFNNERRFGTVNRSDFDVAAERYVRLGQYNCREFNMQKPQYEVIIDHGTYLLGYANTIKLMFLKFIRPAEFREKIGNIVKLNYVKL